MQRHHVSAGILIALVSIWAPSAATAASFVVSPGGENKVVFVSKAANESFEGKTNRLEGTINVDPTKVGDSAAVHFEVDLASLDTGIAMRNRHMRENHLETLKYPKAIFDGAAIRGPRDAALTAGKLVPLDVEGTFTLHGVSRRIRITVQTTYQPNDGGRIAFQTRFPVLLSDYAISRPQFLFLKLAEAQEVRVSGVARAAR
jgi:polyisoprenoid-binding protein YceI